MSRWALPSMIWSGFANPAARYRVSCHVYSTKPDRTTYEAPAAASYRLKSRVSIYDKPASRNDSYYSRPVDFRYPPYSGGYGNYGGYSGFGTSSRRPYEPSYPAASAPTYPKPYYTPARDVYDYEQSRRRYSSSSSKRAEKPKSRKSVHWDDDTFNGRQHDWDRRYDRYGGDSRYDYRQSHDHYGRPTSDARVTSPRATAAGNAYTYTAAAATTSRDSGYYRDEAKRRTQKDFEYGYKFRSSRRSVY